MALPSGYTQLEYIRSDGKQFIDSGVTGSVPIKIEMTVGTRTGTSSSDSMVLASRDSTNNTIPVYWYKGTWYTEVGKTGGQSATGKLSDNTKYEVVFEATTTSHRLTVNGNTLIEKTGSLTGSTKTLYIFARNNNGTASHFAIAEVYELKMHQNGILVRNYVPVRRNSDNALGLYDLVNGVFYRNLGSGTFTAGPVAVVGPVGSRTLIDDVDHQIKNGKCMISGVVYGNYSGKVMLDGVVYDILLEPSAPTEILVNITGEGNEGYCFVTINGIKYTSAKTLVVETGTSIAAYVRSATSSSAAQCYISLDGTKVHSGNGEHTFIPDCAVVNIELAFANAVGVNRIYITTE